MRRLVPLVLLAASAVVTAGCKPDKKEDKTAPAAASSVPVVDSVAVPAHIAMLFRGSDRSADDVKLDNGRHAPAYLAFFGLEPKMRVGELAAGGGYSAELIARAVGPEGVVYGQNPKFILEKFAEKPWTERLTKPVMKNVVRVDREMDDPFPPEAKNLDVVFLTLFYHDTVWMKVDRDKLNKAVYAALKPGGVYAISDHSGRPGTGTGETQTLHRIEEKVVREEVQKAGFRLVAEGAFLRDASDTRDWNASPSAAGERRGSSDRFVLKFVK